MSCLCLCSTMLHLFLAFNCKMESYLWEFWHTNIIYANYQHPKLCRFSKIEYIDSQPNALNISYYLCTKHTVKIHSCAIHPFFLLMYSSIWPIAMHHSIFIPKEISLNIKIISPKKCLSLISSSVSLLISGEAGVLYDDFFGTRIPPLPLFYRRK